MRDPYHDLGVRPDAPPAALEAAYIWVRTHRTASSEDFRRATEAYALLSDPTRREEYDDELLRREHGASLHLVPSPSVGPDSVTPADAPSESRARGRHARAREESHSKIIGFLTKAR